MILGPFGGGFLKYVDIINRIVETEHENQKKTQEVLQQRKTLQEELREEQNQLKAYYSARAQKRIGIVREQENQMADEQIALLKEQRKKDMERIESLYKTHRQEWIDKVFQQVIGG